jgi:hypothetical protein
MSLYFNGRVPISGRHLETRREFAQVIPSSNAEIEPSVSEVQASGKNVLHYGCGRRRFCRLCIRYNHSRRTSILSINRSRRQLHVACIRARSISFASRPRRPYGPPDHERAGETFLHLLISTRRPRRESQLWLLDQLEPSPRSHRRSLARSGERRGATGDGGHPLGEPERVHFRLLPL